MDIYTGDVYYIDDGDLYHVEGTSDAEKIKLKKDAAYLSGIIVTVRNENGIWYLLMADGTFEKMG